LCFHIGGVLRLTLPKDQDEHLSSVGGGFSLFYSLLLVVLGGGEPSYPTATLLSSMGAFKSFLIIKG
jgi:hypothetical protein